MSKHSRGMAFSQGEKVHLYPSVDTQITKSSHFSSQQSSAVFSTEWAVQMAAGGVNQLSSRSQNVPPCD